MNEQSATLQSQATVPYKTSGIRNDHVCATRILGAVFTLLIMLALKRHYSLASADQLNWILAPTARLVAWLTPACPVYEYGAGYVDFAQGIIVAPACAGVNFMIMTFGLAAVCGLMKIVRPVALLIWLTAALCSAYGYTLLINTARIGISMHLYRADLYNDWLTMARLHRLAGIGLYLGALWLFFAGLQNIISRYCKRLPGHFRTKGRTLPDWLPFLWYAGGAAGVPLANVLFQQGAPALAEHCLTVGITTIVVSIIGRAARKTPRRQRK